MSLYSWKGNVNRCKVRSKNSQSANGVTSKPSIAIQSPRNELKNNRAWWLNSHRNRIQMMSKAGGNKEIGENNIHRSGKNGLRSIRLRYRMPHSMSHMTKRNATTFVV